MPNIKTIINLAQHAGCCQKALNWAVTQPDLATAALNISPGWAYWLRCNVHDLPADIQRIAEAKA